LLNGILSLSEKFRLEDVPRPYVQFLLKKEVWRSRPDLWRALAKKGLVFEEPPAPVQEMHQSGPSQMPHNDKELESVDFVFDFGRHAGKRWDEVPMSYRDWLLRQQVWKSKGRENLLDALMKAGFEPS
jgi:hypothetical protein